MQSLLSAGDDLVGGFSPNPVLPGIVSLDMLEALRELHIFTNTLQALSAPHELCIKKALELISARSNYEISKAAFRMELTALCLETGLDGGLDEDGGIWEVNALIRGVESVCNFLLASFDTCMQSHAEFFPYEFYQLHKGRYLFLTKIVFDANLPTFRPTVVTQPSFAAQQMQASYRTDYSAKTDQCIML